VPAGNVAPKATPATAAVDPTDPSAATTELLARADALAVEGRAFEAIDLLSAANRASRDPHVELRLVRLRHEAFAELDLRNGRATWPPVVEDRFEGVAGLPTVDVSELDADVVASAITHHGSLLVRNLLDAEDVATMVAAIDESFLACDSKSYAKVGTRSGSWYQPFRARPTDDPPAPGHRFWVREAGGVLAADSPPAFFTMVEMFEAVGLREVIAGYLGERPVFSVDKCTLRRVPLGLNPPDWHQDGRFLGDDLRVLNVWVALTPCGGDLPCPGLDVVPKRFHELVPTGTDGAYFDWAVGHDCVLRESADAPIIRPEFRAGDALLFDEMFLHRTALDPTMIEERYAIESWFFAPSVYPGDIQPIVF